MKKLSLFLMAGLAMSLFSCDNTDDVPEIKPTTDVVLNNSVETVVTSEESTEAVMDVADYEVDLFSFMQSEYTDAAGTKSGMMGHYANMFREWQRYKSENMPEISVEFGTDGRFPLTITIQYDSIELYNDKIIDGAIKIEMTAAPMTDGAVREITMDLVIDSVEINGEKRVEFTGEPEVSRKWDMTSEITFTFPDGTTLFRSAERTREWLEGVDTIWDLSDDKVQITGKVTCVDSEQNEYTKEIDNENPLIRIGTCLKIVQGVVIFSQNGEQFATLDYGDGKCDNIATYTYTNEQGEEVTKEIELGYHNRHNSNK